jgi:fucokinase
VLIVEQMLTTGGGWQDQVNGLYPGIKLGQSSKSEKDLLVTAKRIRPSEEFVEKLASHMLLVFTGKVRLAKNLLRVIIAI